MKKIKQAQDLKREYLASLSKGDLTKANQIKEAIGDDPAPHVAVSLIGKEVANIFESVRDQLRFTRPVNLIRSMGNQISITTSEDINNPTIVSIDNFEKELIKEYSNPSGVPFKKCQGGITVCI